MHDAQFESIYGPLPHYSEYKCGEQVRYRKSAATTATGTILWVIAPYTDARDRQMPCSYVIEDAGASGFPDIVPQHDILVE